MFEVAALAEVTFKAAAADVVLATDAELCDAARGLAAVEAQVAAARAHVLAELEARGVCDREFGSSTASWVAAHTHEPRPAVAARVRLGTALRRLPVVDDALVEGRICVEHARVA